MGTYASAQMTYGVAFTVEGSFDFPPAWVKDDKWNLPEGLLDQLMAQDGYNYDTDELQEMLDESDGYASGDVLYELLVRLLQLRGWDRTLTIDTHGNVAYDYSAPMIVASGFATRTSVGETSIISRAEMADPRGRTAAAFDAICEELGIPEDRTGWTLTAFYG